MKTMATIKGFATSEGTVRFKERFRGKVDGTFYREREQLWFSSVGIGSYLGDADETTDGLYENGLKAALRSGVNVIDSAINYRFQRSERAFGKAIAELIRTGDVTREEIIICSKGGFIPFDGAYPANPQRYLEKTFIETGILKQRDLAQGCHAMTPAYLNHQLEQSLANFGFETIDLYYVHNPETQLAEVDRKEFLNRMRLAFEFLEKQAEAGKIRMYGTATWNGYRVPPSSREYLSLQELVLLAREIAGPGHHFKAVQLPVNLAMPEAWILANQKYAAFEAPLLGMAERLGVTVIGSGALLQARLTGALPDSLTRNFKNLKTSAQQAIQFARSVPGLTTSLVGMKTESHVLENLEVAKVPPLTEGEMVGIFQNSAS